MTGIQSLHHICIQTSLYSDSYRFYTEIMNGICIKVHKNFHDREYNTWIKIANVLIELQTAEKGTKLNNWSRLNCGPVHIAFLVDDVQKKYEDLISKGYSKFKLKDGSAVYEVLGKPLCKVIAPEGTEIELREDLIDDE
jgi:glyoxylase I family protein